eukprot:jgi/Tetstr1/464958/TSEL_009692.t1
MFGAKWEEYYKNDGTGETLATLPPHAGDRSGEAAAVDIGDTACDRSPADKEHRSYTHMPRWVLRSLFAKYRHLLHNMLDDMGHNRQVETAAKARIIGHMSNLGMEAKDMHAKTDESQKVNSVSNHVLLTFVLRDDGWSDLQDHASHIPDDMLQLQKEGVHVGKHYNIKLLVGGDMKILSGLLGHCGCSSMFPCIYCIVGTDDERAMTLQQWRSACIIMRDIQELELMTHTVMDSRCPSSKCADRDVTSSSAELTDEGISVGM